MEGKKKLLITGWIPEDILAPFREKFSVTVPDAEKVNFSLNEVSEMIDEYDGMFTIDRKSVV